MHVFTLPVTLIGARVPDAFEQMKENNCSGMLVRVKQDFHLLHFESILNAQERGVEMLADVKPYTSITLVNDATAIASGLSLSSPWSSETAYLRFLDDRSLQFICIQDLGPTATLVSRQENGPNGGRRYQSAPPIRRCADAPRHYYPPRKLVPPGRTTCEVDGTPLS